ncbi:MULTISPECIES: energy transducer TonB [unclassified Lysobacter]|uniref:energy transducer TonB n=1 Tax=unclassified Lysobacter TaxID=2635362 RepID=UPI001BE82430|nr:MULTISPECIES: energy transducer TonB [unclassified Lysobacter]MBT2746868.1 energy transducer TonB [Lysobacter sp. ISL-42]MBT2750647.1 energy transducer TonB [Lysobacter sp. ISL-50]MBT2779476.1 energy transducer TonB [Lysobacter sp. ISL-54]MBT2784689.1 energy transducer TonB [Lysobacter sp. ISL-52]
MNTPSQTIDPNRPEHEMPAPEAAAVEAAPSRNGLWLLMLLLAATFMGWFFYGKRPAVAPPAPIHPVVTLPVERTPADGVADDATAAASRQAAVVKAKAAAQRKALAAKPRATDARPIANRSPEPRYPVTALRRGEGGTVVLRVNVGADGVPDDIAIARRSGSRDLDRAAMLAMRDWRFKPATRNGREVASIVEQPVEFRPAQ